MTLEKVQRRAARFVLKNYHPKASVSKMYQAPSQPHLQRGSQHYPFQRGALSYWVQDAIFFSVPFLDFEFFYLFLYFTLKIYQNLLFFQMRMCGISNPRPIIISQTTEPLDQRGMSCQTSDFNP